MASQRPRRTGRHHSILPLRAGQVSNSLSCWYCEWRIRALNEGLFSIGHRYARFLQLWFTIGSAFAVVAVVGVIVSLVWEAARAFHLHGGTNGLSSFSVSWLFGTSSPGHASSFSTWMMNVGAMFFSTTLSVVVHELGHAIAAASEGIPIEYIAIFWAIMFPGALVAFNYDLLQNLPRLAALRIYCAGIWHNLMFCAVCWTTLFLLPLILCPLYLHGEAPMVLEVPQTSPLAGFLSYGDVILAVDGSKIHLPSEWTEKMIQINSQMLNKEGSGRKGYCVPNSWFDGTNNTRVMDDHSPCPDELTTFVTVPCLNSNLPAKVSNTDIDWDRRQKKQCLTAKDIVKLTKCGDEWETLGTGRSECACLEDESCMAPVQISGTSWVEISYSSPYSPECLQLRQNTSVGTEISADKLTACGGTFVFVGDVLSLARYLRLSSYRPRLTYYPAHIPTLLESILSGTFRVSATLGILNSFPVFFLDGESILEMGFCYITWLSRRRRRKALRLCLTGGSILSIIVFARILCTVFGSHSTILLNSYENYYK